LTTPGETFKPHHSITPVGHGAPRPCMQIPPDVGFAERFS
jgi:hypothetical protein